MANGETRINWYHAPLEKDMLRQLTERSNWRGFRQIIPQLLLTAGTGVGAYYASLHLAWPLVIAACYVHATVYSFLGLSGAGHELCHGTPFKSRFWNELFLRLVAFLTWTNFVYFRASHAKHHQKTVYAGLDLEVVLPMTVRRWDWLFIFTVNPLHVLNTLRTTIRHSRGIIKGEWEERIFPESETKKRQELARWAQVMLVGHLALATVFVYFNLWILLALVTFAPFYAGWLNFLCGFTQHVGMSPNVPDHRLCCRTVLLNPLLRFFYWQMNYHVEHHMYPGVPFHRLSTLRKTIEAELPPANRGLFAAWREIMTILRKQAEDPEYVFVPPLPRTTVSG
ncbi:MAG: fatty acid desaturase [Armatimonadota bacterium]